MTLNNIETFLEKKFGTLDNFSSIFRVFWMIFVLFLYKNFPQKNCLPTNPKNIETFPETRHLFFLPYCFGCLIFSEVHFSYQFNLTKAIEACPLSKQTQLMRHAHNGHTAWPIYNYVWNKLGSALNFSSYKNIRKASWKKKGHRQYLNPYKQGLIRVYTVCI